MNPRTSDPVASMITTGPPGSTRRKNNDGTDKEEEKKLAGPLAKKEVPDEGCSRRNGKREEGSPQKKIPDETS